MKRNIIVCISLLCLAGCRAQEKNDINNEPTKQIDIGKDIELKVNVLVPESLIYIQDNSITGNVSKSSGNHMFLAKGDGGFGINLDKEDELIPYDGIKLEVQTKDLDSYNVDIHAVGDSTNINDTVCPDLFKYDENSSRILVDSSRLKGLTICDVTVKATAVDEKGKKYESEGKFSVSLNYTLAEYLHRGDSTLSYLTKTYEMIPKDSVPLETLITKFLKNKNNKDNLDISYDKEQGIENSLQNLQSLTGDQNVKEINLADTNLNDLRALKFMPDLQSINLNGTKINPGDLKLLSDLKHLKKISLERTDLKNIKDIINFLPKIEELDISDNSRIEDLSDLNKLKNLKVLKAENIGLYTLKALEGMTDIEQLDIARNQLAKLSADDAHTLANFSHLKELNVSETGIPDEVLNEYFSKAWKKESLVRFIDRQSQEKSERCFKMNNFLKIQEISKMKSLNFIDIAGNSCPEKPGIYNTDLFSGLEHLAYLDISGTDISSFRSLIDSKNLNNMQLVIWSNPNGGPSHEAFGLPMTADACVAEAYILNKNILDQCKKLENGTEETKTFITPGTGFWKVPEGVYKITISACGGANGGQGGQGGQGGTSSLKRNIYMDRFTPVENSVCGSINFTDKYPCQQAIGALGQHGHNGQLGQKTTVTIDGSVIIDANKMQSDQNLSACSAGGKGGQGGNPGLSNTNHNPQYYQPKFGLNGANGHSTLSIEKEINVTPGQLIHFFIGKGGAGGAGGAGGQFYGCAFADAGKHDESLGLQCAWFGYRGKDGQAGKNGKVVIKYHK